jgi:hypothetical protein
VYPERESKLFFATLNSRAAGVVQSALAVGGCDREIFVLATSSLQFAKAGSALAPSQQEKNNSEDVQRGGFNHRGNVNSTSSSRWPRRL